MKGQKFLPVHLIMLITLVFGLVVPVSAAPAVESGAFATANQNSAVTDISVSQQESGTKTISAKALNDHDCNDSEWHFVITQIESESQAPGSIHVRWANGAEEDVPLEKYTGKTAHYTTRSNLDSEVVEATAVIYDGWGGEFNLSHGPCGNPEPTPTPTPPPSCPECLSVNADINDATMEVSGTGTGSNAVAWRVVRTSDGQVMDSGSGNSASFSFTGVYEVRYQLQFQGTDGSWSSSGCKFSFTPPPPEAPVCNTVDASINDATMEVTGTGSGQNAVAWKVIRVSDGTTMASGTGNSASFSFTGVYETEYQLQFQGTDGSWSSSGCKFSFSPRPDVPACVAADAEIDHATMLVTGTGTGSNAVAWRVVRVSDNRVMASGTGVSASFTFAGVYETEYQLQFQGTDGSWSSSGCKFSFSPPPPEAPICNTVDADINDATMEVSGTGTGSNTVAWRVVRTSDGQVMDSGSGNSASFSFTGVYETGYQLQFQGADESWSTMGCTFKFSPPPPEAPVCNTVDAGINHSTMVVTGSGTGSNAVAWKVIRVSDGTTMASGTGNSASFSFTGVYETGYQLQFQGTDGSWSSSGCTFQFAPQGIPGCITANAAINDTTKVVTGSGTGSNAVAWKVIRVSDGTTMASGTGNSASFSFTGVYETEYQLQFQGTDGSWSSSGCKFSFSPPPPENPICVDVDADINGTTLVITGSGSGNHVSEWRVIRLSDNRVMDDGTGRNANFSFAGAYDTAYQLQFRGQDGSWTNNGCKFSFGKPPSFGRAEMQTTDKAGDETDWIDIPGYGKVELVSVESLEVEVGWDEGAQVDNIIGLHKDDVHGNPKAGEALVNLEPGTVIPAYIDGIYRMYKVTGTSVLPQNPTGYDMMLRKAQSLYGLLIASCDGDWGGTRYSEYIVIETRLVAMRPPVKHQAQ